MPGNKNETFRGYAAVVATALLWSAGGLFIKMVPWSAFSVNAGRCLIALLFKFAARKSFKVRFTASSVFGGVCMTVTTTLFTFANKLTTSANAIMLQYSFPMFLILFSWIFAKIKPRRIDILSSAVIIGGVFLCCLDNFGSGGALGNILAIVSGVAFALYFFMNTFGKASHDDANCIGFFLSFLAGLPWLVRERDFSFQPVFCIIALGAFQLGLAYILLEYGLKRIPVVSASFISAIEPVMNPVWVALFYGERIGFYALAGSLLVVGATIFYGAADARRKAKTG